MSSETAAVPANSPTIAAAIDVGSNSVHLLVARVEGRRLGVPLSLTALDDRSDLIGLGDAVDRDGVIPADQMTATLEAIGRFVDAARNAGADRVVVLGTDPLRRAANAGDLVNAVEVHRGVPFSVLTEHQEALLTFLGVTHGVSPRHALAAIDIGGGSTEVSLHSPGQPLAVVPLGIGSGRLTRELVRNDPPTRAEADALVAAAVGAVADAPWPAGARMLVERMTFVGGTATNIARMGRLTREHLAEDLDALMALRADEVVQRYGVRPRRARQLVAGVAIVLALLDRFRLAQADVSDASLRDGAIVAVAQHGDDWLRSLDAHDTRSSQARSGSSADRSA